MAQFSAPPRRQPPPPPTDEDRAFYHAYINSEEWAALRQRLFEWRGRECQECGETYGEMHVHHLTYVRLGMEYDNDLVILCPSCHEWADSVRAQYRQFAYREYGHDWFNLDQATIWEAFREQYG